MRVIVTCIEIDGEIGVSVECAEPDEDAAWVRAYCELVDAVAWKTEAHEEEARQLAKRYSETKDQDDWERLNTQLINHTIITCHWLIERSHVGRPLQSTRASPDARWLDDGLQFPRLIAEAEGVGAFTDQVYKDLCEAMDVQPEQIAELTDRAQERWEQIKADLYASQQ